MTWTQMPRLMMDGYDQWMYGVLRRYHAECDNVSKPAAWVRAISLN